MVMPSSSSSRSRRRPPLVVAEEGRLFTGRIRTDHAGAGLGLAIVKSIAQAHDGTLTLSPREDGGLKVSVLLPAESRG